MPPKAKEVAHDRSSLEGLSNLQTEILFVLWKHAHDERDPQEVGLSGVQIQSRLNTLRDFDKALAAYNRVMDALNLLIERGETGEGRVGWRTIFVPSRRPPKGKGPGGHPTAVYRL